MKTVVSVPLYPTGDPAACRVFCGIPESHQAWHLAELVVYRMLGIHVGPEFVLYAVEHPKYNGDKIGRIIVDQIFGGTAPPFHRIENRVKMRLAVDFAVDFYLVLTANCRYLVV